MPYPGMHRYAPVCTSMHQYAPQFFEVQNLLNQDKLVCTSMH